MAEQPYSYFDHDADIGVSGHGHTLEAAFEAAAVATFAIMTDLSKVRDARPVHFEFAETDLELALVTWLNRLLAVAHSEGMMFCRFHLKRQDGRWLGEAGGEPWHEGLERGVEVKGATLTMLSVRQTETGWEARCVVDV